MNIGRTCSFDETFDLRWSQTVMSRASKFTYTDTKGCRRLKEKKDKIGEIDQQTWLFARKLVNVYEYPKIKQEYCISKGIVKNPVSRAYYKLWEMLQDFKIDCFGDSLHLAESPGGFIQATVDYRNVKYPKEKYMTYTVSLNSAEGNFEVPKFHNSIYAIKNVEIFDFAGKGDGDITKISTFFCLQEKLKGKEISFVTADGGINDKGNFDNKENLHINLIFSELIQAVFVLKEGGTFIVKIFDIFTDATVNLIYLLSYLFGTVNITKPLTSRSTNSEKYVVCTGFRKEKSKKIRNKLFRLLNCISCGCGIVESLFVVESKEFLTKILKYNQECTDSQIFNIDKILHYVSRDKETFKSLKRSKENIIKNWLLKYNLIRV